MRKIPRLTSAQLGNTIRGSTSEFLRKNQNYCVLQLKFTIKDYVLFHILNTMQKHGTCAISFSVTGLAQDMNVAEYQVAGALTALRMDGIVYRNGRKSSHFYLRQGLYGMISMWSPQEMPIPAGLQPYGAVPFDRRKIPDPTLDSKTAFVSQQFDDVVARINTIRAAVLEDMKVADQVREFMSSSVVRELMDLVSSLAGK